MSEVQQTAWRAGPGVEISASKRALLLALSSFCLCVACPGILPVGQLRLVVGVLGLGLWAFAACRTGPRRKLLEWVAGAVYGAWLMSWVGYVTPPSVAWIGVGWGFYYVFAGLLLRRLLHHIGLPLAAALAYTAGEGLRTLISTPIGISWVRMGHLAAEWPSLRGAAAWIGVDGLGFLLTALGGLLAVWVLRSASIYKESRAAKAGPATRWQAGWVLSCLGLAWFAGSSRAEYAAGFEPGPRVLLVQPGFTQARKREMNSGRSIEQFMDEQMALSFAGLADEAKAGRTVDLVAWGESMLPLDLIGADLAAVAAGDLASLNWPEWDVPAAEGAGFVARKLSDEAAVVGQVRRGRFFEIGGPAAQEFRKSYSAKDAQLMGQTAFCAGAIVWDLAGEAPNQRVRRAIGVALWNAQGERQGEAWKRHLVPGAEGLMGLEESALAREWAGKLMPYVPDMQPGLETGILEVERSDRKGTWRMAGAVCFDNGFEDVFLEGALEGRADFALVASNEAWYETSHEFDQMIAMTQLWAVESGRAIARVTNSGISGLWDAAGNELARLEVEGADRAVSGALAVTIPVPVGAPVPFFAHFSLTIRWALLALPFLLIGLFGLLGGQRQAAVLITNELECSGNRQGHSG